MYLDKSKEQAIDIAIKNRMPVMLVGETGVGKTTLVSEFARKNLKLRKLSRISINDQVGREDLIGKYNLVDSSTVWSDGPLTKAMREGSWIVLDELNSARPEVLFALHSILDHERSILLNEKDNEIVKCHSEFRLFATMNPPSYHGVKNLNQAMLSRFMIIGIDVLNPEDEQKLIEEVSKLDDKKVLDQLTNISQTLRDCKKEGQIDYFCSTRDLIATAQSVKSGMQLEYAVLFNIINKMTAEDYEYVLSTASTVTEFINKCSEGKESLSSLIEKAEKTIQEASEAKSKLKTLSSELALLTDRKEAQKKEIDSLFKKKEDLERTLNDFTKLSESEKKIIAQEYLKTVL